MERLHIDYIDILQIHDAEHCDIKTFVQEVLPTVQALRDSGRIRAFGITGYPLGMIYIHTYVCVFFFFDKMYILQNFSHKHYNLQKKITLKQILLLHTDNVLSLTVEPQTKVSYQRQNHIMLLLSMRHHWVLDMQAKKQYNLGCRLQMRCWYVF